MLDTEITWDLGPVPDPPPMSVEEQVVEAIADALSYRLLVLEAFDQLREKTLECDRLREQLTQMRREMRREVT